MNADAFNAAYPVGTPVLAYPFVRPDDPIAVAFRERAATGRLFKGADTDPCTRLVTRTRSKAQVLGGHTDVVWVDDHGACIALDHVDVVSEDVWKAAKEADDLAAAVASKAKAAEDAADCRRRIYVDGKGDGWIDLSIDPETGERELTGITNPWKIASAEDVRNDTGGLTEIGRCW